MKEITDMVTLRAFALKQAVASGESTDYIVATAEKFADFIKGNAELPEYENRSADTMKFYADLLKQSKESSDEWHNKLLSDNEKFFERTQNDVIKQANDKIAELEKELAEYKSQNPK